MQRYIGTLSTATLSSGWHGAKSPTAFGTELLAANGKYQSQGHTRARRPE